MAKGNFLTGGIFVDGETPVLKSDVVMPANQALQQVMQQPIAQPKPVMLAQNNATENSPMYIAPIKIQDLPSNMPKVEFQAQFPGPYAPNSPEIQDFKKNEAFQSGNLLTPDRLNLLKGFATDNFKSYTGKVLRKEPSISSLILKPNALDLYNRVTAEAIKQGGDPRLAGVQSLHETNDGENIPGNNPAGIKISRVTKNAVNSIQDPMVKQKVFKALFGLKSTRENLTTASKEQLAELFSDNRTTFKNNPPKDRKGVVHGDILNKNAETTERLNNALKKSREANDFSILKNELDLVQEENPQQTLKTPGGVKYQTNNMYWLSQHFMQYPTIEDGVADQVRIHSSGGKNDTSNWILDTQNKTFTRTLPNGSKTEYKY